MMNEREEAAPHARRTLVLLWFISLVSLFDRVQIPTLLQPIKTEFHLTDAQLGLLSGTAFGLPYAAAAIPMAWLADRYSRRYLLGAALGLWAVTTAASGTARNFGQLLLTRVGVASGESAFTPTAHAVLAETFPSSRLGWAIGVETSGGTIGIVAGMSVAGLVAAAFGWRAAMVVASVPALLMVVAVLLFLPNRNQPARFSAVSARSSARWFSGPYATLVGLAILNSIMSTGWAQWLPTFFQRSHRMVIGQAGPAVGIATGVGLLLGSLAGGAASAFMKGRSPRTPHLFCAAICTLVAPTFGMALWLPGVDASLIFAGITSLLVGMLAPFIFSEIQAICNPSGRAQAVATAMTLVTIISYGILPPVIGKLSDLLEPRLAGDSLRGALSVTLAAPIVGSLLFLCLGLMAGSQIRRED